MRARGAVGLLRTLITSLALAGVSFPAVTAEPVPAPLPPTRIVLFERLPGDAVERLRRAGVTHAALFEGAAAAAVVGTPEAYRRIRSWSDVVAVYPEAAYLAATFQATAQTGVDRVQEGARPLRTAYTGRGVTVAVADTGIDTTHPDLDDRVAASLNFEPSAILDPITDGEYSRSSAEMATGTDENGHGTFVGGIVAGTGEAAVGADMRGVAPGATLVDLRLGGATWTGFTHRETALIQESSTLAAFQWVLDHRDDPRFPGGIRVINNSWSDPEQANAPWTLALTRMLERLQDAGIAVVFATGNNPDGPGPVHSPGTLPWVITVGANCKTQDDWSGACADGVAYYSGRGPTVDVVAPGEGIWTPHSTHAVNTPPGWDPRDFVLPGSPPPPGAGDVTAELHNRLWYTWANGTSAAAPHVTGVIALMLEANPDLMPAQIESILQATATDIGATGFDELSGYGQVDAFAAVRRAEHAPSPRRDVDPWLVDAPTVSEGPAS